MPGVHTAGPVLVLVVLNIYERFSSTSNQHSIRRRVRASYLDGTIWRMSQAQLLRNNQDMIS